MSKSRLSQKVTCIPPSGIRRFFDIAATMKDVISLGIGEPDFVTPAHISQAGIESIQRGDTHYTSNSGTLELRSALSDKLFEMYGVRYSAENEILITVGVSEALQCAMLAVIDPGDEVLVVEPCFVAYKPSVVLAGGTAVMVPTYVENDFQVTAEELERHITPQTKAIFIGYPNNPTGAVLGKQRLQQIADLAEKYDLLVISDEIYDRLVYGVEHTNFASLPRMQERTILLGGFSKSYAMTGWRVGYVCANPEILGAIRKVHQYAIMSAPTMAQHAALEALRHGEQDVRDMVNEYDLRRQTILAGLNTIGLPTFEPHGAFYVFPDIRPTGLSSNDFSEKLLMEEHVAAVPGDAFGESGAGFVRMSYCNSMENLEEALTRIERLVKSQK
ncbi:MAG: aminotransferase class I/II-fold pyridoxal phosphate-dependent enzyme [Chloroflexi bacterium]|nr:aminotransferase class I/II-fold pyridoxal phosphate-dependent enzyme [Chloroflexota bacterium]